jgi:hypothetical protein
MGVGRKVEGEEKRAVARTRITVQIRAAMKFVLSVRNPKALRVPVSVTAFFYYSQ